MRAVLLAAAALLGAAVPVTAQDTPAPAQAAASAAPIGQSAGKAPDPAPGSPVLTEAQRGNQVAVGGAVMPGPDTAYILFRTSRPMGLVFLRETTSAEREMERETARRNAQDAFRAAVAEWERIEAACHGDGAAAYRCRRPRPHPVEPDLTDVDDLIPIERNAVTILRRPVFSVADGMSVYLVPVFPGSYVLHAQREDIIGQSSGVCLCMGSLRFDVGAGQVVDIGTITYPALEATGARPRATSAFVEGQGPSIAIIPATNGPPPPGLAGITIVPAQLRAAGKAPNHYRLYVDRHPAVAGVLRYERDRVIDERTGEDPSPLP